MKTLIVRYKVKADKADENQQGKCTAFCGAQAQSEPVIQGEGVKTKTIQQTVRFKGSPREVYELLMNSKKHQSLSGENAVISTNVPGKFKAWNGHITGFNLALIPGMKIVQAWRATDWWPGHYSIAIFNIEKAKDGSLLRFTQIGVPSHRYRSSPSGLRYASFKLSDGVSFVHIVSVETADGHNPLIETPAFKAFNAGIQDRCEEQLS